MSSAEYQLHKQLGILQAKANVVVHCGGPLWWSTVVVHCGGPWEGGGEWGGGGEAKVTLSNTDAGWFGLVWFIGG